MGSVGRSFETVGCLLGGRCEAEIVAGKCTVYLGCQFQGCFKFQAEAGITTEHDIATSNKGLDGSGVTGKAINWISTQYYAGFLG